ncbi:hypothetical protein FD43_GL001096 [Apilactobacillus kunkeei DSM 12361 = ATCC 700308]|uniref:Uncharacterized protein n=1 Tax=Apilactobacillus kunkeei DSM 12361 = ATCC 700308 TaxID=1423768 RepID=A0A0R1FQY8_9LACO|nr:hypothetical protein [Apilactobacillus kunkeei]KOY74700.1 hypothetical protein RZ79_06160 [Apilactobacillus kunkeei DSM 12361 = ATCC 700308]KRK24284.1 hypothetical protein FD43_GL001096 [Apilactobacillus kunkeei DSM 12361 = ATCC 700308]QYU53228.1 hypothetical protein K2W83_00845 [Apilactobacillus kunkeei]
MNKKFKNMALSIIPLSVILMSYCSNDYAKASINKGNQLSTLNNGVETKEVINSALKIESELEDYYQQTLGYVKGNFINDLSEAINYDQDTQATFAKEIQDAMNSVKFDKSSNEADAKLKYLDFISKALDEAMKILDKYDSEMENDAEYESLKDSIDSDLNQLSNTINEVQSNNDKTDSKIIELEEKNIDVYLNDLDKAMDEAISVQKNLIAKSDDKIYASNVDEINGLLNELMDAQSKLNNANANESLKIDGSLKSINESVASLNSVFNDVKNYNRKDYNKLNKDQLINVNSKVEELRREIKKVKKENKKNTSNMSKAHVNSIDKKLNGINITLKDFDKSNSNDIILVLEKITSKTNDLQNTLNKIKGHSSKSDKRINSFENRIVNADLSLNRSFYAAMDDNKTTKDNIDKLNQVRITNSLNDLSKKIDEAKLDSSYLDKGIDVKSINDKLSAFNRSINDLNNNLNKNDSNLINATQNKIANELSALHVAFSQADKDNNNYNAEVKKNSENYVNNKIASFITVVAEFKNDDTKDNYDSLYNALNDLKKVGVNDKNSLQKVQSIVKSMQDNVSLDAKTDLIGVDDVENDINKYHELFGNALDKLDADQNSKQDDFGNKFNEQQSNMVIKDDDELFLRMFAEDDTDSYQESPLTGIPSGYEKQFHQYLIENLKKSPKIAEIVHNLEMKLSNVKSLKDKFTLLNGMDEKKVISSKDLSDDLSQLYGHVDKLKTDDTNEMYSAQVNLDSITTEINQLKANYATALVDAASNDKKSSDNQKANDDKKSSDAQKASDDKKPSDDQKTNDDKKSSDAQKANDDKNASDSQKANVDNKPSGKQNGINDKQPNKTNDDQNSKDAKNNHKTKKASIKKNKKVLANLTKKLKNKKLTKRSKKAIIKKINALKKRIKLAIVKRDKKKLLKINKKLHSKKISKKTRKHLNKQATALRKEIKKNYVKPTKKKAVKKTVKKHSKKSKKINKKSKKDAKKTKKAAKKSVKKAKKAAKKSKKAAKKAAKKSKKVAKKTKKHQKKLTKRAAKKIQTDQKAIAKINKKLKFKHLTKKHRRSLIAKRAQLRKAIRKLTK